MKALDADRERWECGVLGLGVSLIGAEMNESRSSLL